MWIKWQIKKKKKGTNLWNRMIPTIHSFLIIIFGIIYTYAYKHARIYIDCYAKVESPCELGFCSRKKNNKRRLFNLVVAIVFRKWSKKRRMIWRHTFIIRVSKCYKWNAFWPMYLHRKCWTMFCGQVMTDMRHKWFEHLNEWRYLHTSFTLRFN